MERVEASATEYTEHTEIRQKIFYRKDEESAKEEFTRET